MKAAHKVFGFGIAAGAAVAAVVVVVLVSGGGSVRHQSTGHPRVVTHVEASEAKPYTSLAELKGDSTAVAVLRSTGTSKTVTFGGVPWTITTMAVVKILAGNSLPATIDLRQLSDQGAAGPPVVSTGNTYVAYIQPFELQPGVPDPSGQYVVVGGLQGLFQQAGTTLPTDTASQTFSRVDPNATGLPASISLSQAAES